MTVVGKILVFLNLVFSLLVGGLVILAFSKRENWVAAHKKERNLRVAIETSREQVVKESEVKEQSYLKQIQALKKSKEAVDGELTKAQGEVTDLKKKLSDNTKAVDKSDTNTTVTQAASASRAEEVQGLETALAASKDQIKALVIERRKLNADKVRAEIESNGYRQRVEGMEDEIRRLARLLAKKSTAGSTPVAAVGGRDAKNPPPQDLEGTVVSVDAASNLLTIKPGSDAGLERGHTLEVFRLGKNPKYLGRIRIESVRPHEAAGRPVKRTAFPIQPGDRVASRIQVGR